MQRVSIGKPFHVTENVYVARGTPNFQASSWQEFMFVNEGSKISGNTEKSINL
jgi:hypothetical protein